MTDSGTDAAARGIESEKPVRVTEFQRFRRVFFDRKVVIFGFVVILLLIVTAIFAPLLAPYNPYNQDLSVVSARPSAQHILGTDEIGRDVLSRVIYGTRISLMVGVVAVGVAAAIGVTLGMISGYFGGWTDNIIMRFIDALMAIPGLVLALVFAAMLGGGLKNIMIAVGVSLVPTYCRLMRGQVFAVKGADYILAAHSLGARDWRIMLRHIFPNCLPPLIVLVTLQLGMAILIEAGLSFIGIGIAPPGAAWGSMVSEGYRFPANAWLSIAPGLSIMLVVLAFNLVGDGLRDALDPRLRGII
ncbi:MAG TPA: ABC transporter permease [Dehalococcoidales bacterium]|nr:ABC transporter permease [Dehalococcoidales bacterium]